MTENGFSNFSSQSAVPPFHESQQQNFNPLYNMNSKESSINNNVFYQATSNPHIANNFPYQNTNFSSGSVRPAPPTAGDYRFLQPNNVIVSNPFEICPSSKNISPSYHSQTYQIPRNVQHPQQTHHLPQAIPTFHEANRKMHCSNEIPYQNCADSTSASPVPQVFMASSSSHGGSGRNCNIEYSVDEKSNHNLNPQNIPPHWNEVPSPQLGTNKSFTNAQFSHNPQALNVSHEVNFKPNFSAVESNGVAVKQAVSFPADVNQRPVLSYFNSPNTQNGPPFPYSSQSPYSFRNDPPPNVPQMMPPKVVKTELSSSGTCYPFRHPVSPQTFNSGPVVPAIPPNPYTMYSHLPMSVQNHSIPMQMPNITSFPPPPCVTFSKPPSDAFQLRENIVENKLSTFLVKFQSKFSECNNKNENSIAIAEFRSKLKLGFTVLKTMTELKSQLLKSIQMEESLWNSEVSKINALQDQLFEISSFLTHNVELVKVKLKKIKRKRNLKRKQKMFQKIYQEKCKQERLELHQKIDRMLDLIKEKNLKLKRESEMKKEADDILSEVRRKIQEANRTLEKLKAFEKLRNARKESALQKSHFVLPSHDANFEEKVSTLRNTMLKQLCDYEAEERALKVMLETEQEGQLEEEALWRLKRLKQFQKKKQKDIQESLFGTSEEPQPTDPLFLFYQHYNAGNTSVENLVQIRHHWDMFLVPPDSEEASAVPQRWVTPELPKNASWEVAQR